jgi:hypothetical protein
MAQLKGPILFTGSVGGIRAYYNKTLKRYVVSTKGGSTKEIINNNPTMERQRENMSEFKGCTKMASQLRRALDSISHLRQGYYFSQLVALAKLIQKQDDEGIKGTRSILLSKYSRLLLSFNFNQLHPFDQVFAQRYEVSFSEDKRTVTLKLPELKSASRIYWPSGFEAYRIALVIVQQPDWTWNLEGKRFEPVVKNLELKTVTTFSGWRSRNTVPEDIVLTATFEEAALQLPGTTVVVAMGIEVSAYQLDTFVINTTGVGTMKIVECFV